MSHTWNGKRLPAPGKLAQGQHPEVQAVTLQTPASVVRYGAVSPGP